MMRAFAVVLACLGAPLIMWLAGRLIVPPDLPEVAVKSAGLVKDAAGGLASASQWLGTVSVSALAAGGVIILKERQGHPVLCRIAAAVGLGTGLASILFACALSYWTAVGIGGSTLDIASLARLYNLQALFALGPAVALCALLVGGSHHAP